MKCFSPTFLSKQKKLKPIITGSQQSSDLKEALDSEVEKTKLMEESMQKLGKLYIEIGLYFCSGTFVVYSIK